MIPAVLDHLWQSTLLAAAIGVLAVVFRRARASVRYGLWLTASAKFLFPFAALAALGRLLAPGIRPPAAAQPDAVFIARAAEPFSVTPQPGVPFDPALLLLTVWALGVAAVLVVWTVRGMRIRPMLRQATPVALAAPMPVLSTPTMMEPGLVGLWRPVLLIPETLFDHLDRPSIEALVAHEACHYRRRDNLTAAVHMLVEALFWFHPMVWWIGGRLVEERERACDEAVTGSGHDPGVYARSLLECCRLFLQSPLRCVAGASGSNLSRRVEMIMTSLPRPRLSRSCKAALLAAGACALASPVAAGWLTSPTIRQSLASSPVRALVQAVTTAPDTSQTLRANGPGRAEASPTARTQWIATLRHDPIRLDAAPNLTLSNPLADAPRSDASLQLAQLQSSQADNGSAQPSGEPARDAGVTYDRKGRKCWAGRPGCAPEDHTIGAGGVWAPDYARPGHGDSVGPIDAGPTRPIPAPAKRQAAAGVSQTTLALASKTELPDARVIPVADSNAAPSESGGKSTVCMRAASDSPRPGEPSVKTLCMTRDDWKKAIVRPKDCWATRYGCAPEGGGFSVGGSSSFPQLSGPLDFANTGPNGQTGSPAPTYTSGGYGPQH